MAGGNLSKAYGITKILCSPIGFLIVVWGVMSDGFKTHVYETISARSAIEFGHPNDDLPRYVVWIHNISVLLSLCTFVAGVCIYFRTTRHHTGATFSMNVVILGLAVILVFCLIEALYQLLQNGIDGWWNRIHSLSKWVVIIVSLDRKFETAAMKGIFIYGFYYFFWDESIVLTVCVPLSYSFFVMSMVAFYGASFDNYDLINSFQTSFVMPILLESLKEPLIRALTIAKITLSDDVKKNLKVDAWIVAVYTFPILFGYVIRCTPVLNTIRRSQAPIQIVPPPPQELQAIEIRP